VEQNASNVAASNILIENNYVGTNITGSAAIGNGGDGITVSSANDVTIGGSISGMGNLISGNKGNGIQLEAAFVQPHTQDTLIQGNLIGLNATGASIIGNGANGIFQNGADYTTIGGTTAGARNVIGGNTGFVDAGISVGTGNYALIEGNYLGTDITGTLPLGNYIGLLWSNGSYTTVGGTTAAARNVISGNTNGGIDSFVLGSGNEVIEGNYIGVDVTGTEKLPNGSWGIRIAGPTDNTIGGTVQGAGNVISANNGVGLVFDDNDDQGTVVEGNFIGTDATGTLNLGNQETGIVINSDDVTIGGTSAAAGNIIAYNHKTFGNNGDGVQLSNVNDAILSNSIYSNAGLGINFGNGPTPNHEWPPGPTGPGPNNDQNYPVLTSATSGLGNTTIQGLLNAAANTQFLIQFFSNPQKDPSGYGQGQTYLGSETVTTGSNYKVSFSDTFPGLTVPGGSYITATATDPSGNTSEFSPDFGVQVTVQVSISAAALPSPNVYVGGTLAYTLTVDNYGTEADSGVVVTDTLDPNVTYQSATSSVSGVTPTFNGTVVTANLGALAAGAMPTVTIIVTVNPGAVISPETEGQVVNYASVATTYSNANKQPPVSTKTVVLPVSDVAISTITTTPAPNYVGANLVYTITAVNNGPSEDTGVTVTDTLPALTDVTVVSATTSVTGVTPTVVGNVVTADFGGLAAGASVTMIITVTPTAAAVGDSPLSDTATISGDNYDPYTNNNSLTISTPITASSDLQVGIIPTPSPVLAGQNVTYTITATNNGPSAANGVVVTDTIPGDVTFDSATGGATPDANGNITFTIPNSLADGGTMTFQVIVTVTGTTASPTKDTASISGGQYDPVTGNNTATVSVPITAVSNLALNLASSSSSVYVGASLTYTIMAINNGPSAEPDAVVTDTLDPNVTFVSATGGVAPVGNLLTFNLGSLPSGASATLQVVVAPLPAAAVPLTGTVSNTATFTGQNYPNAILTQTIPTTVNALTGLAITSLQASANPRVDQPLVFTIVATNNGPSDATGVILTDLLPSVPTDVAFVSATTSTGVILPLSGSTVTADIGNLAAGASVTMTITVTPTAAAVGEPLSDTATINGEQENLGNNSQTISLSVSPTVDLVVALSAAPNPVEIQNNLTYSLSVQNTGPSDATNVSLVDTLPANATFVSATGGVTQVGTSVTFNVGSLAVDASASYQIVVSPTAAALVTSSVTNTVSAQATESLVNPSDSQASVTTTVLDHVGTIEFSSTNYAVPQDAGSASITVNRVDGLRGTVTVDYTTVAQNAIPGINFTPVSGTLTFAPGVASQTIVVPVLNDPYTSQNQLVSIVLSNVQTIIPAGQPGQGILGTPSTATLTIQVVNPNFTPLTVTNVQWTGTAQNIREIFVTFNKPLIASTATDPLNYTLINLGSDEKYGSLDNTAVQLDAPTYSQSIWTVTLTPTQPLSANQFFHLEINGTAPGGVEDVGANLLSGNGSTPGTDYTAELARGTNLRYYTPSDAQVKLKITGGGIMDDWLSGTGQGIKLSVVDEVPHHTVLSGTIKKSRTGSGEAYLGYTLYGLGNFGDVRVKMHSPPFQITVYPFSPGMTAASRASTAPVVNLYGVVVNSAATRSVKTPLTRSTQKVSSMAVAGKTTGKKLPTGVAGSMNRPFHAFPR